MRRAGHALASLLAATAARAEVSPRVPAQMEVPAEVPLRTAGCTAALSMEVSRLLRLERRMHGARLGLRCEGTRVELRSARARRDVDLGQVEESARARLLALAAIELLDGRDEGRQRVHTRRKERGSEMKTFAHILSGALVVPLLVSSALALPAPAATKKILQLPTATTPRSLAATRKPDGDAAAPSAPSIRTDEAFGTVGEKLREVNDAQIRVLERLLDNTAAGDPDRADLLFRMGELYGERRRHESFRARGLDQPIFDASARGDAALVARLRAQRQSAELRAEKALLESARRYLEVAERPEYAAYARMDEVLFYLAWLLNDAKHEDAARKYLKQLIKDHPTSKFIPDAYLAFADYYFEKKEIESAIRLYEKVAGFPDSRVYGYARYKLGWCYLNLGEHRKALDMFVEVIELAGRGQGAGNKENRLALGREAKRDAVRAFAQVGEARQASEFFRRIGGDYASTMLEQLGELWSGMGRYAGAIDVYHQLMAASPASPKICAWQYQVVQSTLGRAGSRADEQSVTELVRLASIYERQHARNAKGELARECQDATSNTLRELATTWHREADKTHQPGTYFAARRLYETWLAHFAGDPDDYQMRYWLGELLYAMAALPGAKPEIFCDAAEVYSRVVRQDPPGGATLRVDAAWSAVLAWKGCLGIDDGARIVEESSDAKRERGERLAPRPIPEAWRKMIVAFEEYLRYVKASPELPTVLYRLALTYYEYNHFAEAIPWFTDLVRHHVDSPLAIFSADLIIDSRAALEQGKELRADVAELCASPRLIADAGFAKRCRYISESLLRDDAEQLERSKRWREAADLYARIAADYPDSARLDEALYNEAIDFQRAKLLGRAIAALRQLVEGKPDSPLAKRALFQLARTYRDIAAYESAAESLERYAARYGDDKEAPTALLTAAFFRRGLGQSDRAVDDAERFITTWGARSAYADRAAGAWFGAAQIFDERRDWDRLAAHLETYLREFGARGGVDRQIAAHVRLGEIAWRASCPVTPDHGACITVTRPSSVAQAIKRTVKRRRVGAGEICGSGLHVVVERRDAKRSRAALEHFAAALKLWDGGAAVARLTAADETERATRIAEMSALAAEARMIEGDAAYEALLELRIPDQLDFARKKVQSTKRFTAWLDGKVAGIERARRIYDDVIHFKQAHWAIAASARIGQLFQDLSGQLATAPVPLPPPVPPGANAREFAETFRDAYCGALDEQITVLEDKAVDALARCVSTSTKLSWYGDWSALCEAELNQLRPLAYPLATEIRAEPGYASVILESRPPRLIGEPPAD